VTKPRLLILKDPLDQFYLEEVSEIMDFLTDPNNGWALVIVSENPNWTKHCERIITMQDGRILNDKKGKNA